MDVEIGISAPPSAVWNVLAHPTRWPPWTASMTSVEPLGQPELGPGARVRIRQPRLPALEWQVIAWQPGSSFTWAAKSGGVTTVATHTVLPAGADRSRLVLGVSQHGLLAPLVRAATGRLTRRYLEMEAAGHKAAAEAGPIA
ncbi:polyketide cyclase [Georgenia yuyongxinii]|uniref:Polyketide cyclase n=1 Tax=Georgenia yuyongxinii TaxID=2589797 RepID=A0A5B8C365_9MICO|nr:SRPBCC family protein [Georgenia yuyongxinii]QDC25159.1 polyketide cyclase [Georgenia yuyongxinii]